MVAKFSEETKELLAKALEIALELGSDHISTIHFFLANCHSDFNYNPKDFIFSAEDDFEKFYAGQKNGESKKMETGKLLPLTEEAMRTIRLSVKLKREIKSQHVLPIHLLLAATRIENSDFLSICGHKENAYQRLLDFYKSKGYIVNSPHQSFISKIKRLLFYKNN